MSGGGLTGAAIGGLLGYALAPMTGGASLALTLAGAGVGAVAGHNTLNPDVPSTSSPSTLNNLTGSVIDSGNTKTLDENAQTSQRTAVTKARLGAKQLQIPLANAAAAGINTSPQGVNS